MIMARVSESRGVDFMAMASNNRLATTEATLSKAVEYLVVVVVVVVCGFVLLPVVFL